MITTHDDLFVNIKQASKQGGKLLFNLSSKELRGGYRLATEVAL